MAVIKGCAAFHPFLATLPRARTQGRWRRRAASHEALVREDSAPVGRAAEDAGGVGRQDAGPKGSAQDQVAASRRWWLGSRLGLWGKPGISTIRNFSSLKSQFFRKGKHANMLVDLRKKTEKN